ncbi:putative uridine kinase C227.14 isoform X1 [Beta vulgaris subsp. vulgaris]|uniref:putative uridine kinase C227.14 isoform X1 n=1 Tax=Beta vulgaris subsp. vulgaris TaxID=3555 RepID=UPI002036CB58|nr:putative uridine kinase C227.14 isoform X1 [Beta vulgaris subsp. vulgaris]
MEISSFSPTSRTHTIFPSSRDFHKGVGLPSWHHASISVALTAKRVQPLLYVVRPNSENKGTLKVSCSRKSDASLLEARSMDEVYDSLAQRLIPTAAVTSNPNLKYIVGLAGPPGAGKSTVAHEVVQRINKLWPQKSPSMDEQVGSPDVAIVLPMDGFHLYRSQLDAMEDPKEAHARRGAPWTFDPARLLKCLQTLRSQGSVCVPSFDHGVGDPIEDDIFVSLQHKVVILEGNYLLLDEGVWNDISTMFDEKWFIDVDLDTAMQRVLKRHVSKSKKPLDEAKWRIEYNDRPNAEMIMKSKKNANLIIRSIEIS